jgi:hypothetical protein
LRGSKGSIKINYPYDNQRFPSARQAGPERALTSYAASEPGYRDLLCIRREAAFSWLRAAGFAGLPLLGLLTGCANHVASQAAYVPPSQVPPPWQSPETQKAQPADEASPARTFDNPASIGDVLQDQPTPGDAVKPPPPEPETPVLPSPARKPPPQFTGRTDFGGTKVGPETPSLFDQAGGTKTSSIWPSFVSYAFAAAPPTPTCSKDEAAQDPTIDPLSRRQSITDFSSADFLPGMNNVPWGAMVNGSFVVLSGVAVLRSHATPAGDITIEVYPGWASVRDKAAAKPAITLSATVRTYEAQNGFVFRAITHSPASPIACLDLLIPYNGLRALAGRLHYHRGGAEYAAGFIPARLR